MNDAVVVTKIIAQKVLYYAVLGFVMDQSVKYSKEYTNWCFRKKP